MCESFNAGWGCCKCKTYNENQQPTCSQCPHGRCLSATATVTREQADALVRDLVTAAEHLNSFLLAIETDPRLSSMSLMNILREIGEAGSLEKIGPMLETILPRIMGLVGEDIALLASAAVSPSAVPN